MPNHTLRKYIFTILAGTALASCSTNAGGSSPTKLQALEDTTSILQPWVSDSAPGVAVAISVNDEVVFAKGAGLANLEHDTPIGADSVFQVASVSKQFTAFATLLLVSDGTLKLDEDIRTYLPELNQTSRVVTVAHLLDHMGGLRERNLLAAMAGWMEDDIQTEEQLFGLVARQDDVNFLAGDEVEYSNTGYALLAKIVSRVSGESFQSFMTNRVFSPLGMTQSKFLDSRHEIVRNRASSYAPAGDGFEKILSVQEAYGSTGLYTTALDLLKWAENFETQTVGGAAVFEMMAERASAANGKPSTFGRGQELRQYQGLETWSHGGRDAGYRSFLLRVPEEDFEVAILSNRSDFDTAAMAFSFADIYLSASDRYGDESTKSFVPATAKDLVAYEGDYEFYPGVIFSLEATPDGLTFAPLGADRDGLQPLVQIGTRQFELNRESNISIIFTPPVDGKSYGFGYKIGLHGTLDAHRINLAPFETENVAIMAYAGVYESSELEARYTLFAEDDLLFARHIRLPEFALTPYQPDTFSGLGGPLQKVEFVRDETGNITGFLASAPLVERILFKRVDKR
jgi:CubicO group peptidase (beta-lactamase class C family)